MYVPAAVRRAVIRTLDIVSEIRKLTGKAPAKIFVEMAMDHTNDKKGKRTVSRKKQVEDYLKKLPDTEELLAQLEWNREIKDEVWTLIVYEKIHKQAEHLASLGYSESAEKLSGYLSEIELCDKTNREGHAAKVYFNALFGMSFSRGEAGAVNAALNYGYSLVLGAVNREVCACGYLTQLGLFHDNMFNEFNLSCDLMEPFRIVVDRFVKAKIYALSD